MTFEFISLSEWCDKVGMPRMSAMNYINRGILHAKKISGRWMIEKDTPKPQKIPWGSNRVPVEDVEWE